MSLIADSRAASPERRPVPGPYPDAAGPARPPFATRREVAAR